MGYFYYFSLEITKAIELILLFCLFSHIHFRIFVKNKIVNAGILGLILLIVSILFNYLFNNSSNELFIYLIYMISISFILFKGKDSKIITTVIWAIGILYCNDFFAGIIRSMYIGNGFSKIEQLWISMIITCAYFCIISAAMAMIFHKKPELNIYSCIFIFLIAAFDKWSISYRFSINTFITSDALSTDNYASYNAAVWGYYITLSLTIMVSSLIIMYKDKLKLSEELIKQQKNQYIFWGQRETLTRKFRHDIKNHMLVLQNLINSNNQQKALEYISQINYSSNPFSMVTVNNCIVDAIINHYLLLSKEKNITLNITGAWPDEVCISDFDICTIVSNILQNAFDAAKDSREHCINISFGYDNNSINITESNPCMSNYIINNNIIKTTKKNTANHGFGLSNIKEAVQKNNGKMSVNVNNYIFTIKILLNSAGGTNDCNN